MRAGLGSGLGADWARFQGNQSGNVAVIFAAVMLPVIGVVATAIDYGRASKARDQLAHACESAAQAASTSLELDRDRLSKLVRTQLDANLPLAFQDLPFEMTIPSDKMSIEITVATQVRTSVMGIVGIPEIGVSGSGFSRRPTPKLPGETEGPAVARAPEPSSGFSELWRAMFGGAGPAPELLRQVQEDAARAAQRSREASPDAMPAAPAGLPDLGPIRNSEDLRRAARELEGQWRDLPQFSGGPAPQEIERMMRDMRRHR